MKKLRYLIPLIILFSCSPSDESLLIGKWKFDSIINSEKESIVKVSTEDYMEAKEDKSFYYILYNAEKESSGTWELDNRNLKYTYNSTNPNDEIVIRNYEITELSENKLVLLEKEINYSFKK